MANEDHHYADAPVESHSSVRSKEHRRKKKKCVEEVDTYEQDDTGSRRHRHRHRSQDYDPADPATGPNAYEALGYQDEEVGDFSEVYPSEQPTEDPRETRRSHRHKKKRSQHGSPTSSPSRTRHRSKGFAPANEQYPIDEYNDEETEYVAEATEDYSYQPEPRYVNQPLRNNFMSPESSVLSGSVNFHQPPRGIPEAASVLSGHSRLESQLSASHPPSSIGLQSNSGIGAIGLGGNDQKYWNPEVGQPTQQMEARSQPPPIGRFQRLLSSLRRPAKKTVTQSQGDLRGFGGDLESPGVGATAKVTMLDGEEVTFPVDTKDVGQSLFARVCAHVDLVETDYFGLTYVSNKMRTWFWLDLDKRIARQLKGGEAWVFHLQFKFYPPEPALLQEDITRYQLALQIRQDIFTGKLPCSWVTQALLGSFMVQSELGDYDHEHHQTLDYLQEFEFVPSPTKQLLQKIAELHTTHVGMTPSQADLKYLETAKRLELYGVDLHPARDMEDVEIYIGVGFNGVLIYRDRVRIGRFAWPKVLRISYKKNNFYLKIRPDYNEPVEAIVGFRLMNHHLAKRLWKCAVEHHAFFRLKEPHQTKRAGGIGSQYRFSGRTFFQYRTMNVDRRHPNFNRSLTKRRTTSMPGELNKVGSIYSLNRPHPRDMTIGRTQNSDQSRAKLVDSSSNLAIGQSQQQMYHTVPRGMGLSGSVMSSGSHASKSYGAPVEGSLLSQQSRSASYNVALPTNDKYSTSSHDYSRPPARGSRAPESFLSEESVGSGTVNPKPRRPRGEPLYANTGAGRFDDEISTYSAVSQATEQQAPSSHSKGSKRAPPYGGVAVLGGAMLQPSQSSILSRRSDRHYDSEEDLDHDENQWDAVPHKPTGRINGKAGTNHYRAPTNYESEQDSVVDSSFHQPPQTKSRPPTAAKPPHIARTPHKSSRRQPAEDDML